MRGNIITVGTGLAVALLVVGCRDRSSETTSGGEVVSSRATVRVADVVSNPERYTGRTVTVEADVDSVLSPFALTLNSGLPLRGGLDYDLIIAYPQSLNLATFDDKWLNNKVRARGTLRRMTVADFERVLGRDLSPKLEQEFMRQPVLMARSVERIATP